MALAQVKPREHIYELDPIRGLTALGVVAVHTTAFTAILVSTVLARETQFGVVSLLHFTREIFIAITAFLMVYVYGGRPFPAKRFWGKRGVGVFVPYALWSVVYTWINNWIDNPHATPLNWIQALAFNILTGNAEFQLYYILLTLELYLALPWILAWIARWGRHPWRLLGISGALQLLLMAVDYRFFEAQPFAKTAFGVFWDALQNRFLPFYQFYIVMGGLAAMYRPQLQAWVLRHGRLVLSGFALGTALLLGNLVWQVNVQHQAPDYGAAVFQPAMVFYALGVAAFIYWRALVWSVRRQPSKPWAFGFWHLLSDASFGVYLIHPLLLNPALALAPKLPVSWPEPCRVFLVWFAVAGGTVAICAMMLHLPVLSRLIGHPCAIDWNEVGWVRALRVRLSSGSGGAAPQPAVAAASAEVIAIGRAEVALPPVEERPGAEINTR